MSSDILVAPVASTPTLPFTTRGIIVVTAVFAGAYLAGLFLFMTAGALVTLEQSFRAPQWFVIATNIPFVYVAVRICVWMFRKTYATECAIEQTRSSQAPPVAVVTGG